MNRRREKISNEEAFPPLIQEHLHISIVVISYNGKYDDDKHDHKDDDYKITSRTLRSFHHIYSASPTSMHPSIV